MLTDAKSFVGLCVQKAGDTDDDAMKAASWLVTSNHIISDIISA